MNINDGRDLPLGLTMALAQNQDAMQVFSNMSDEEKERVLSLAQNASSKSEMHQIVDSII